MGKQEVPSSVNTRLRVTLMGLTCLGLIMGAWIWSIRSEFAEAFEVVACRSFCTPLAPEELRLQVIKAYLHRRLDENRARHDAGGNWQLALLPRDMTASEAEKSIRDATLLAVVTTETTALVTHAKINALTLGALANDPTIAVYSLTHREVDIIPTSSIREASKAEVEDHFRVSRRGQMSFSPWERWRGYGARFFWITYWQLYLACCDGRGESAGGSSPDEMNEYSLMDIRSARPRLMAVSDRGAILARHHGGYEFIHF